MSKERCHPVTFICDLLSASSRNFWRACRSKLHPQSDTSWIFGKDYGTHPGCSNFTLFPEFSMVSYCSHYILTRFHGPRVLEKSVPSIAWGACTTRCVICDEKCGSVEWDPVFGLMPCMSPCLSLLGGPWVLKWCLSCRVVVLVQTFQRFRKVMRGAFFFTLLTSRLAALSDFYFKTSHTWHLWYHDGFPSIDFLGKKRQLFP